MGPGLLALYKLVISHETPLKKLCWHLKAYQLSFKFKGDKNNPNPLVHPNPFTNCPIKPTYLINRQIGVSPIKPN